MLTRLAAPAVAVFAFLVVSLPAQAEPIWSADVTVSAAAGGRPLGGATLHVVVTSGDQCLLDLDAVTNATGVVALVIPDATAVPEDEAGGTTLLAVKPNPANGAAVLRTRGSDGSGTIELFDVRGRRVASVAPDAAAVDLGAGGLAGGVYFLRQRAADGPTLVTRFVVTDRLQDFRLDTGPTAAVKEGRDPAPLSLTLDVARHGYLPRRVVMALSAGHHQIAIPLEWDSSPSLARTWLFCNDIGLNAAAVDSGWLLAAGDTCQYDRVIAYAGADGFRYWQGKQSLPDSCTWNPNDFVLYTHGHPDDRLPWAPATLGMFWMDLSTLADDDLVIENAWLIVSPSRWGTFPPPDGGGSWAVMDTTATDLSWLEAPPARPNGDPRLRATTWNRADRQAGIPWQPALSTRDDWHDFGPRSRVVTRGAAELTAVRYDVTDVLQQYVDRAGRRTNAGWIIAGSSRDSYSLSLGTSVPFQAANHQPVLVVTWSKRPYARPWGRFGLPFVMTIDDNDTSQITYARMCRERGAVYSPVVPGYAIRGYSSGSTCSLTRDDLVTLARDGFDVVMHSRNHTDLGGIAFGDRVATDLELQRRWVQDVWGANVDTSRFATFAWPVLCQAPVYSPWIMKELVAYGYTCARTAGASSWTEGLGRPTKLAWDRPVNLYAIACANVWDLTGEEGSDPGPAEIDENVDDLINRCWQDGRAPVIIYWHDTKEKEFGDPCSWQHGVDFDEFGWTLDAIAARDNVWIATFPEVVDHYLRTAEFLAPDPAFAASFFDSLLSLGHEEFGRMWARQPVPTPADRGGEDERWRP